VNLLGYCLATVNETPLFYFFIKLIINLFVYL